MLAIPYPVWKRVNPNKSAISVIWSGRLFPTIVARPKTELRASGFRQQFQVGPAPRVGGDDLEAGHLLPECAAFG